MDQTDVFRMSTGSFAGPEWHYGNTTYNPPHAPGTYPIYSPQMSPEQLQGNIAFASLRAETNSPTESADRTRHRNSRPENGSKKARSPKSVASEEESPEEKSLRRREQNRMAQRTFRERKDRYIQNLEEHIKALNAKQQDLLTSYNRSTEQVKSLYTQLLDLQNEVEYLRSVSGRGSSSPADSTALPPHLSMSYANSPEGAAIVQAQLELQSYGLPPGHSHMPL